MVGKSSRMVNKQGKKRRGALVHGVSLQLTMSPGRSGSLVPRNTCSRSRTRQKGKRGQQEHVNLVELPRAGSEIREGKQLLT